MFVRKSFQFRLRPTKKQANRLQTQLDQCRWLYNELLLHRKLSYEELNLFLSKYQQQKMFLPMLKEERASLNSVHSQVLQNVVDHLDKSFQVFFHRCKEGEKPGFSRFRGEHRYNSFCYPKSGSFCEMRIIPSKHKMESVAIDGGWDLLLHFQKEKGSRIHALKKGGEKDLAKVQRKMGEITAKRS